MHEAVRAGLGTGQGGLDADVTDRYGNTVLLVAAALGHLTVVHAAVQVPPQAAAAAAPGPGRRGANLRDSSRRHVPGPGPGRHRAGGGRGTRLG